VTCSSAVPSTLTRIVIREISACSVGPTASDSMLNPRRLNSPDTRASTPGLFSTSTERVWVVMIASFPIAPDFVVCGERILRDRFLVLVEGRPDAPGCLDVVVARAGGHHRPHHRVLADGEVDDDRGVVYRHRLLDGAVHVVLRLATQPDAAQG